MNRHSIDRLRHLVAVFVGASLALVPSSRPLAALPPAVCPAINWGITAGPTWGAPTFSGGKYSYVMSATWFTDCKNFANASSTCQTCARYELKAFDVPQTVIEDECFSTPL